MNKPENTAAIDQERKVFDLTVNGSEAVLRFDPASPLDNLPPGGGILVGDGNCWKASNDKSKSQFLSQDELDKMIAILNDAGWRCITVPNELAGNVWKRSDFDKDHAVVALGQYAADLVARNGSFDSGHVVRASRGDNSFGQRAIVSDDFLTIQNSGGYQSPWMDDVVEIAHDALLQGFEPEELAENKKAFKAMSLERQKAARKAKADLALFNIRPDGEIGESTKKSERPLAAVAVAVFDPWTGELRLRPDGQPWGTGFIIRRIIGLNNVMRGKGEHAPGNPMRAALRRANAHMAPINRERRARSDWLIQHILIPAFREHGRINPVMSEA